MQVWGKKRMIESVAGGSGSEVVGKKRDGSEVPMISEQTAVPNSVG